MQEILEQIQKLGIVPVVKIESAEDAAPLAKALMEGGLPCAEVTFRTEEAEEAIHRITSEFPDMLIGAGTVLTTDQADRAVKAGARFIVSPGLNPKVVKYCVEKGIPVVPGCSNPSDIEQAIELGLKVVKFFPAEAAGGLNMVKAMSAPYGSIRFMPTGGITEKNLLSYLDFPKIIACGGSWMVKEELIHKKEFDKIKELTREAVMKMLGFELRHVGINAENETEADSIASSFEKLFGFAKNIGNASIFAGLGIEVMKQSYLGKHGHIAIATNYLERAVYYLKNHGFCFDESTMKYDDRNRKVAIYLKDEIGGFAVHLLQK